jgi:DnaJ-class molecular chaperone
MNNSYYTYLGVDPSASSDEIKKTFKTLTSKYHPDKQHGKSDEEVKQITEKYMTIKKAYEVLSDHSKRQIYDRYGEEGLHQESQSHHQMRGSLRPLVHHLQLTINELYTGCTKKITYDRQIFSGMQGHTKQRSERNTIDVHIPPKTRFETQLMMQCEGHRFPEMNLEGDLVIVVSEAPNSNSDWSFIHDQLVYTISIGVKELLIGFTKSFTHLNGEKLEVIAHHSKPHDLIYYYFIVNRRGFIASEDLYIKFKVSNEKVPHSIIKLLSNDQNITDDSSDSSNPSNSPNIASTKNSTPNSFIINNLSYTDKINERVTESQQSFQTQSCQMQ